MRIAPPTKVYSRPIRPAARGEVAIRYGAAYGCTLLAVVAAKLHIADSLAFTLIAITLAGLPVSLWLRHTDLRLGSLHLQRPFLNSVVVCCSMLAALYHLVQIQPELLAGNFYNVFMLRGEPRATIPVSYTHLTLPTTPYV